MKQENKGQVAMEFMMTYGWAILAAMIVIAALAYFGITNPTTVLPDKCTFSNAFQCSDYQITPTETSVRLMNTLGQTIYEDAGGSISAELTDYPSEPPCTVQSFSNGVLGPAPTELVPEGIIQVVCTNPDAGLSAGDKLRTKITVTYSKVPSGYDQVSLGEVYATVQ